MFGQSSTSGNKPLCHFYQKGICKYGNKCWNLHTGSPGGNVFGASPSNSVRFSSFGGNPSAQQNDQFGEFVKQVSTEMNVWEKNGQWPLSCLAPLKEHPILVGFVDTSPEELRVEAYEALKATNIAAYQTSVNQKLAYHKQLRDALKSQVPEAIEALKCVFYKTNNTSGSVATGASSSTTSLFGKPSTAGPFAGSSTPAQPSLFGGASSTPSAFGAPPSLGGVGGGGIFGSKPQTSAFGVAPVFGSQPNKPLDGGSAFKATTFGGQGSSSLFGGATAATNNPAAGSNLFGGGSSLNQGMQGSLFGGSGSVFGSPSTGSQNNKVGTGPFGAVSGSQNPATPSVFGGTTGGSFGGSTSGGFGTSNIFGSPQQPQPAQTSSTSSGGGVMSNPDSMKLFGAVPQSSGNPQGGVFGGGGGMTGNTPTLFGGTQNQQPTGATGGVFGSTFGSLSQQQQQQQQQQNPSSSMFGNFANNSTPAVGGNTTAAFGNSPFGAASSPFGSGTPNDQQKLGSAPMTSTLTSAPSLLSQTLNNANSWFTAGSAAPPTAITQPVNPFGNQTVSNAGFSQPSSAVFGAQPLPPSGAEVNFNSNSVAQNMFGGSSQVTGTTAATAPSTTPTTDSDSQQTNKLYTPLHLLTSEDREEFQKDMFSRVPLVPPPRELCF